MHNYANVYTINQSKSLPSFLVVMTSLDVINGRSIQTLLREENDSKQSDEIQASTFHVAVRLFSNGRIIVYTFCLINICFSLSDA